MYILLFILLLLLLSIIIVGLRYLYIKYSRYNQYIYPEGDVYVNFV